MARNVKATPPRGPRTEIERAISRALPLRSLTKSQVASLARSSKVERLRKGEFLVRQGEEGNEVFIILTGSVTVSLEKGGAPLDISEIGPGSFAGEIAAVAGGKRSASLRASRPSKVLRITRDGFQALVKKRPDLLGAIAEQAHKRLLSNNLRRALHDLLGITDHQALDKIENSVVWHHLHAGDTLFEEGDMALSSYLVVIGRIRVADPSSEGAVVTDAGPGQMVGFEAALGEGVRTAAASAVRDSYIAELGLAALEVIGDHEPIALLRMSRHLIHSRSAARSRHRTDQTSIALLAASDSDELRVFATRLVECLQEHGSVFHIWSAKADSIFQRKDISQSEERGPEHLNLTRWLHELEDRHRTILFECDRTWSGWTRRALHQADQILILAGRGSGSVGDVERRIQALLPQPGRSRVRLVILHDSAGEGLPRDTSRWLEGRDVDDWFHIRSNDRQDLQRLARILTGRALGVVFGGGGARGFAHLGVMRALAEIGKPIDYVAGASIGAVAAAAAATEIPQEEIPALVKKRFRSLADYTLPSTSLIKGRKITQGMIHQYGDACIEDLWLPYFCVSSNLTKARLEVHRRGPLVQALRASIAIPGYLPPVPIDQDIHVDGGVMNNLPADEMRSLYPDAQILAIDVVPPAGPRARYDYGLWLSGWRAALGKASGKRTPGIADTLVRATVAASLRDRNRLVDEGVADFYLSLNLRGVGLLQFDRSDEIITKGYEQSMPSLQKWLAGQPSDVE